MHILHLSAHLKMDRRITGEMNSLVKQGHYVYFLSRPIDVNGADINKRIVLLFNPCKTTHSSSFTSKTKITFWKLLTYTPVFFQKHLYGFLIKLRNCFMYSYFNRMLSKIQNNIAFDIIHIHDLCLIPYALKLKKKYKNAQLIYDSHELTPFQDRNIGFNKHLLQLEKKYIKKVDAVITVNDSIAEYMSQLYKIQKPFVLYNSVESIPNHTYTTSISDFLKHFNCENLPENAVKVIYQGSLIPNRNLENLVTAFKYLDFRYHLFLLGEGPLKKHLQILAPSNVHFGKHVEQNQLLTYTQHADFGIIPYLGDYCKNNYLCTPNKLFEYIEAKIPVCSSDLPELRKIITKYENGIVYNMHTWQNIKKAIELLSIKINKKKILQSQLNKIAIDFSHEKQMSILNEIYETVTIK